MNPVAVRILHPASSPDAGPLERWLAEARLPNARRLAELFKGAGATDVDIDESPASGSFGGRLRGLASEVDPGGGLVVLGSGSIPLATPRDAADLVRIAGSGENRALANNRFSADVVAVGRIGTLRGVPDLPADNALPRWLEEAAGFEVRDLRHRWWLAFDLDSPLDVVLLDRSGRGAMTTSIPGDVDLGPVLDRIERIRSVAADRRAELVIAGRTNAATIRWLERCTACRVRAVVEERGLRASTRKAFGGGNGPGTRNGSPGSSGSADAGSSPDAGTPWANPPPRPPRSVLGMLLDHRGGSALGSVLAELGDGAVVDSRVQLAHRVGVDEARWPSAEDRFASDLLLAEGIGDSWLRVITRAVRDAPIPILLGGHTLVGPGLRLLLGPQS